MFDEVDEALGEKLSTIIFEGPEADADPHAQRPARADGRQPCRDAGAGGAKEFRSNSHATYVAGHSLGEYSALAAAGSLSVGDTARLLRLRGDAMQKAVPEGVGAMAALLGLELEQARDVADAAATADEVCQVANDNAPGQVVVSGHKAAVERAIEIAKERGRQAGNAACRLRALPLRADAAGGRGHGERACTRHDPCAGRVRSSRMSLAAPIADPTEIRKRLVEQVTGTVRWRESMMWLGANGVTRLVEIGAGKVLTGLAKRACPARRLAQSARPEDVRALAAELRG